MLHTLERSHARTHCHTSTTPQVGARYLTALPERWSLDHHGSTGFRLPSKQPHGEVQDSVAGPETRHRLDRQAIIDSVYTLQGLKAPVTGGQPAQPSCPCTGVCISLQPVRLHIQWAE